LDLGNFSIPFILHPVLKFISNYTPFSCPLAAVQDFFLSLDI
jgi:hypothetical protein